MTSYILVFVMTLSLNFEAQAQTPPHPFDPPIISTTPANTLSSSGGGCPIVQEDLNMDGYNDLVLGHNNLTSLNGTSAHIYHLKDGINANRMDEKSSELIPLQIDPGNSLPRYATAITQMDSNGSMLANGSPDFITFSNTGRLAVHLNKATESARTQNSSGTNKKATDAQIRFTAPTGILVPPFANTPRSDVRFAGLEVGEFNGDGLQDVALCGDSEHWLYSWIPVANTGVLVAPGDGKGGFKPILNVNPGVRCLALKKTFLEGPLDRTADFVYLHDIQGSYNL